MLKVSRRLNYGLQLMMSLANEDPKTSCSTATLSRRLHIPLPFLHQIAHILMRSGLIKATPGPKGGLRVGRSPEKITLLNIFEALEGKFAIPTSDTAENLKTSEEQVTNALWEDAGVTVCKFFSDITLDELVKRTQSR